MTKLEPRDLKFMFRVSLSPHFVSPNTSTNKIPKKTKRMSHRPSKLRMTGKLDLNKNKC